MEHEEPFSDDPEEQLRTENELMKLKLQAEFGAMFGGNTNLPPEIEQEFLKHVMAYEQHHTTAPLVMIFDYLGRPEYPLAAVLSESELEASLEKLENLLREKQILLDFGEAELPAAAKYDFVTNEVFPLQIQEPPPGIGNLVFSYEDFHPDHQRYMEEIVADFMRDFFGNHFDEDTDYLSRQLVSDKGPVTIAAFIEAVERFQGLFAGIKDYAYNISETKVDEPQHEGEMTMGFVEGAIRYTAILGGGEEQVISGPFKCYMQYAGSWELFHFVLHGFSWA